MIIAHAFLVALASSSISDGYTKFKNLTTQLDHQIVWIDTRGSEKISKSAAVENLNRLIRQMKAPKFHVRHQSSWRDNHCFKILHVTSEGSGYRLYFQCAKGVLDKMVVTKIKISPL